MIFFPRLETYCRENGIAFRIESEPNNPEIVPDARPTDFLYVDFGTDASRAHALTRDMMTFLFGAAARDGFRYELFGIDPERRKISTPALSEQVWRKYPFPQFPRPTRLTARVIGAVLLLLAIMSLIYGHLARAYAAVFGIEIGWTVYPFSLLGISVEPRLFDLLGLVILARSLFRYDRLRRKSSNSPVRPWMAGGGERPADGPPKDRPDPFDRPRQKFLVFLWVLSGGTVLSWL